MNEELLKKIWLESRNYNSKKEIDEHIINEQFIKNDYTYYLTVGNIELYSGKIEIGDPLCYMYGKKEFCLLLKSPVKEGIYPVEVSMIKSSLIGIRICTARLKLKDTKAVKYLRIDKDDDLCDFSYNKDDRKGDWDYGFPVETGLAAFTDAKEAENYRKFLNDWYEKNPDKNHYNDYFQDFFIESYNKMPQLQVKDGDFICWQNPNSGKNVVMTESGFGDGFYRIHKGLDNKGEVCEIIIPYINPRFVKKIEGFEKLGGIVTQKALDEGIGYMYRDEPQKDRPDSGWRFFYGDESEEYSNNVKNVKIVSLNTIIQVSPDVENILDKPAGSAFYRDNDGKLKPEKRY